MHPSSGFVICYNHLENSRKYYLYLLVYYKDIIKNTNDQPDEEVNSAESIPNPEASVLVELGCIMLATHGCIHQLKKPPELHHLGLCMEVSSHRYDQF